MKIIFALVVSLLSLNASAQLLDSNYDVSAFDNFIANVNGPKVSVEVSAPDGTHTGSFQVVLSDDQKTLNGVLLYKDGDAKPTMLTADQILASSQQAPLTLLEHGLLGGKLVMIYKDPALTRTGGKINVLIRHDGQIISAGFMEVEFHAGGWVLTANGRSFSKIVMELSFGSGVKSLQYQ